MQEFNPIKPSGVTAKNVNVGDVTVTSLPDVTIDNGPGAAAVNIQDGGNSITVDGTITVVATNLDIRDLVYTQDSITAHQGGTWTIDTITNTVTVDGTVTIEDGGGSITVDGTLSVTQSGTWNINNISGTISLPTGAATAANQNTHNIYFGGWTNAGSDGISVSGDKAHDSADGGEPLKIGGKAIDYEPDSSGEQGATDVAAADRVNGAFNLKGEQVECVKAEYDSPTNVSTTYDNSTTTATSAAIDCWQYRHCTIAYELDVNNTPTDITIAVEVSLDGSNWVKLTNDALGKLIYSDTAIGSGLEEGYSFPIAAYKLRIKVTATGTDASNTFTIANFRVYLRN